MRRLIKLSVLLVLLITPNVLFAHKSAEEKAKLVATKLNEKLVLTPDQLQKVTDIYTAHFNNINALKEQTKNSTKEEKMKLLKEQWKNTDKQVKDILTADQKLKYDQAKKETRQAIKKRRAIKPKKEKKAIGNDGVEELLDEEAY